MGGRFLRISFFLLLVCLATSISAGPSAIAREPKIEASDTMIPSGDAGVQLFVRNKHLAGRETSPDKILLFAGLAPVAAVPSACPAVPERILFGEENKNYGAGYRAAREAMEAELPENLAARQRAYLLLKRHGQEICKRTKPKCEICPVSAMCEFFLEKRPGNL